MTVFLTILIMIACFVLAFFILVQQPKGGGLAGNFGSLGTQVMGVKNSSDVMEKGTWTLMGLIAALCIISVMFMSKPSKGTNRIQEPVNNSAPAN